MTQILTLAFIFFASWNGVFALGERLRLPVVIMALAIIPAVILALARRKLSIAAVRREDFFLVLFFAVYASSAVVHANENYINYVVAYAFVLLIQYLLVKMILTNFFKKNEFHYANIAGVGIVGLFLSLNFLLTFFLSINIQDDLPRISQAPTASYRIGAVSFNRGYAFSTEPGVVAFYLNVLGPVALWFLWRQTRVRLTLKTLVTLLVGFGWLVTFSAAGWVFLPLGYLTAKAFLVGMSVKRYFRFRVGARKAFFALVCAVVLVGAISKPEVQQAFAPLINKITLTEGLKTTDHRLERWFAGLEAGFEKPIFGQGARYFSADGQSSSLNWYLMLFSEGGVASLLPMLAFLALVLRRMLLSGVAGKLPFLTGYFAGCGHLAVVSGFHYPAFWILLAMFYAEEARCRKGAIGKGRSSPMVRGEPVGLPATKRNL